MNEYVVSINRKKVNEQLNDPSLWVPSDTAAAAAATAAATAADNDDDDDTMFFNTNAPICLWIVLLIIVCP